MALPTKSDLLTGQFSADGSPFVQVSAKAGIDTNTLEYSADGSPFWAIEEVGASGGHIKRFVTVPIANIKFALGVPSANIKRIIV
jgi:hypothetical protein